MPSFTPQIAQPHADPRCNDGYVVWQTVETACSPVIIVIITIAHFHNYPIFLHYICRLVVDQNNTRKHIRHNAQLFRSLTEFYSYFEVLVIMNCD